MLLSILCPATQAVIKLGSSVLDDAGAFTKFVLQSVAEHYSLEDISNVVGLGKAIVEEEVLYLKNIGFLLSDDYDLLKCELSDSGREFYTLMNVVERANDETYSALVENYTGKVIKACELVDLKKMDSMMARLPIMTQKQLFYNTNYSNSLELFISEHTEMLSILSERFKASLYSQLEFDIKENVYIYLTAEIYNDTLFDFKSERNFVEFQESALDISISVEDERINKYRAAIKTLELLLNMDSDLLSDKAKLLLAQYRVENNLNYSMKNFSINNSKSGDLLTTEKNDCFFLAPKILKNPNDCSIEQLLTEAGIKIEDLLDLSISDFFDKVEYIAESGGLISHPNIKCITRKEIVIPDLIYINSNIRTITERLVNKKIPYRLFLENTLNENGESLCAVE